MKVLIADGSEEIVNRLDEILFEHPMVQMILKATSYNCAKVIFNDHKPDIVLLDNNFPENKSLKLLAEIKADFYTTKVIMLSLHHNEYINNQCKIRGANYFIDKYHDFDKITALLTSIKTGVPMEN